MRLNSRLKRLEAKGNTKHDIYLVEKVDGLYHIKTSGTDEIKRMTLKRFNSWEQENDNSIIIHVKWAD